MHSWRIVVLNQLLVDVSLVANGLLVMDGSLVVNWGVDIDVRVLVDCSGVVSHGSVHDFADVLMLNWHLVMSHFVVVPMREVCLMIVAVAEVAMVKFAVVEASVVTTEEVVSFVFCDMSVFMAMTMTSIGVLMNRAEVVVRSAVVVGLPVVAKLGLSVHISMDCFGSLLNMSGIYRFWFSVSRFILGLGFGTGGGGTQLGLERSSGLSSRFSFSWFSMFVGVTTEHGGLSLCFGLGFSFGVGLGIGFLYKFFVDTIGAHAVLEKVLVGKSGLFMLGYMRVRLGNVVRVVMQVVGGIMSMIQLLVLPLVLDLAHQKRMVVRSVLTWLVVMQVVRVVGLGGVAGEVEVEMCVMLIRDAGLMVQVVSRLHFKDKVAGRAVDIGWVKDRAIGLESSAGLVPPSAVKGVEVIAPVEVKLVGVVVVGEDLNVVVKHVPRHVGWVEAFSPRVESGCPEVHAERLSLLHEVD